MHCRNDHSTFLGSHNNKHLSVMKFKFMMNSERRTPSWSLSLWWTVTYVKVPFRTKPQFPFNIFWSRTQFLRVKWSHTSPTLDKNQWLNINIYSIYIKWSLAALYTFLCIFIFFTLWDLYARRSHDGFQDSTVRGCGNTLGGRYSGPISIGRCVHQYTAFAPMSRRVYMLYRV